MKKAIHVNPRANGDWSVRTAGSSKPLKVCSTEMDAIAVGTSVAKRRGTSLWVHRADGSVRSKDSFGSDPFPPLGKFRGIPEDGA